MCALCGVIAKEHWAEQDGDGDARVFRAALLNRVLGHFGLSVARLGGRGLRPARPQGRTAVVSDLGALWIEAERLLGSPARPTRSRRSSPRSAP